MVVRVVAVRSMKLRTLKPTLRTLSSATANLNALSGSWRTGNQTAAQRGYGYKWQKAREEYLRHNPLCVMCDATNRVEVATVVDHKIPHRGDMVLFWDRSNWQSLCKSHHDGDKKREENAGGKSYAS